MTQVFSDLYQVCAALQDLPEGEEKGEKGKYISDLLKVYFDALHNPPLGYIGVGAITYAEDSLVAYQLAKGA
jgi:hypothetical protein